MPVNREAYREIKAKLDGNNIAIVAVSKTRTVAEIKELYDMGQRDFGENYVQEMIEKQARLPPDIRWHFIGHLQSNKVKTIAPFVQLIQSVDSLKLLEEINKQGTKINRVIDCLLQVYIAQEETKFGLDENELKEILTRSLPALKYVRVTGLMGMASLTGNMNQVRKEFRLLKKLFDEHAELLIANCPLPTLSMGMSADYKMAAEEGSNMVRIGSLLFGERRKKN